MEREEPSYVAIDLKSFFESVEWVVRGLYPMTTNLVVADASRTEKTICLAVSPSLKAHGIGGRPRLFEVVQRVQEVNAKRQRQAPGRKYSGSYWDARTLDASPVMKLDFITAPPRMALYIRYRAEIYQIYLKYVAPEDIHVYSIDEVFLDVTKYLKAWGLTARQLTVRMIQDVYEATHITATAGIGTNLYLCKVAMDIVAKHIPADQNGVRIAKLDERMYRRLLWGHRPITDFWRVGRGYARKLESHGLYTMGDIARCSLGKPGDYHNPELLYKLFGVNAELLIDHAWGWEPCTMADIKAYKPQAKSLGSGQVLSCPYSFEKARLIVREMADLLSLQLADQDLETDQLVLTVGYDTASETDDFDGEMTVDHYGRRIPKHAHGTVNLDARTSSTERITAAVMELYDRIVNPKLLVRRVNVVAGRVEPEKSEDGEDVYEQLDLFTDYEALQREREAERRRRSREKRLQKAVLAIQKKYGKNAVLKGMNLQEGAMTQERNRQIGGHRA